MPAIHSEFNQEQNVQLACNVPILPLNTTRTKVKGPAPPCMAETDIVDEAIRYFRVNILFRNFELEGPADRTIAYLTAYLADVVRHVKRHKTKQEAEQSVFVFAKKNFKIPGDAGFAFGGFFADPADRAESDLIRGYIKQLREEAAHRILDKLYNDDGTQNKHWFQFSKKKFMNLADV
ncbi:MAG: hypothetical protein MHM6MM_005663 [Cercozoa sp. M6MM]